ncbi:chymotrypsin-1-like [Hylaeus volcanicus]|uniref:chymotrypsin-1-like n=1 Tax=Hylaeus volcanicus TaxID=313075 RepID=UPI0023B85553|nr:chymotrypsin-1-like [Hylaeus volcanicus]
MTSSSRTSNCDGPALIHHRCEWEEARRKGRWRRLLGEEATRRGSSVHGREGFPGTQIVGGSDAPIGKFPYQVSLQYNGHHFCGGSIISKRHILTAAHCMKAVPDIRKITVHVGINLLSQSGAVYNVESATLHPNFSLHSDDNDVAVIRVNKNIAFNAKVKAIPLATGNVPDGSSCVLSGWGTKAGGSIPNKLQYANFHIEPLSKCQQAWRGIADVQSTHVCTIAKVGQGVCNGDNGGPLVANGQQIGIVCFAHPCGVGSPDVYTRVSSFSSWIKEQQSLIQNEEESDVDVVEEPSQ